MPAATPETRPLEGQVFLVTGGRRGIGAKIAQGLAEQGAHLAISYASDDPNKAKRSGPLEKELQELGTEYRLVRADVSTPEGRRTLIEAGREVGNFLKTEFKGFRGVVANAAAGLEADGGEYYAHQVNFEGNKALVNETRDIMAPGGDYMFVQSLWGHQDRPADFNGNKRARLLPFYGLIARTKFDFESWIRGEAPDLREMGINVKVLVAHVVDKTGAFLMLKRYFPDRLEALRQTVQGEQFQTPNGPRFPDVDDVGKTGVDLIVTPAPQDSVATVYVGGDTAEPADPKIFLPYDYDRRQVGKILPMYSSSTLYVDRFISGEDKMKGRAERTIRKGDVQGHFTGPFRDIKLLRGVIIPEMGAQAMAMIFKGLEPQEGVPLEDQMAGYFKRIPETDIDVMVLPGDNLICDAEVTAMSGRNFKGRASFRVGDEVIAEPKGFVLGIAPYKLLLDAYEKTRARRERLRAATA